MLKWRHWKKANDLTCNSLPMVEKELGIGLVNRSFLVRSGKFRAVVRVNSIDSDKLGIDRLRESQILEALEGKEFVPNILYCDEDVLVTEYISGVKLDKESLKSSEFRSHLSSVLCRIQTTYVTDMNRFSYLECCNSYARNLPYNPSEVVDWQRLCLVAKEIDRSFWAPVLCHHDLIADNIIIRRDSIVFIDWEFAALGHPAFDYVKLFGENTPRGMLSGSDISPSVIKQIKFLQSAIDDLWFAAQNILKGSSDERGQND